MSPFCHSWSCALAGNLPLPPSSPPVSHLKLSLDISFPPEDLKDFSPFPAPSQQGQTLPCLPDGQIHCIIIIVENPEGTRFPCTLIEDVYSRWDFAHFTLEYNLESRASAFFSQAVCKEAGK